jgi:hypothetical protein
LADQVDDGGGAVEDRAEYGDGEVGGEHDFPFLWGIVLLDTPSRDAVLLYDKPATRSVTSVGSRVCPVVPNTR